MDINDKANVISHQSNNTQRLTIDYGEKLIKNNSYGNDSNKLSFSNSFNKPCATTLGAA
ncbi:hypothetical protein RI543_000896 [Arxiozyma heterogenica]|uniref:Uncharacterized protein n=1 Tax=Arxiozyma heterogenica TaxID=278026 RepID=A0AAN8A9P3_9SACH|nr:hypothetical protein RI543_000896 [Kazachstania heterogenica]